MRNPVVPLDQDYVLDTLLALPAKVPKAIGAREYPSYASLAYPFWDSREQAAEKTAKAINGLNLSPNIGLHLEDEPTETPSYLRRYQRPTAGALFRSNEVQLSADNHLHLADHLVGVFFEEPDHDPFELSSIFNFTREKDEGKQKVHDRIVTYIQASFAEQHRTFLLVLLVTEKWVRIIRCDREGVATTPAINYVQQWTWFAEVLQRISILAKHAPECIGFDPTATRIYPDDPRWTIMDNATLFQDGDMNILERVLSDGEATEPFTWKYARQIFQSTLEDASSARYELTVPDETEEDGLRRFLVGDAHYVAPLDRGAGPGCRGYLALDVRSGEFTWLKDVWRLDCGDGVDREGEILAKLNAGGVNNVPTLLCHGDVNGHRTQTVSLWKLFGPDSWQQWVKDAMDALPNAVKRDSEYWEPNYSGFKVPHIPGFRHYRLVTREVCMSLWRFTNPRQLLTLVNDCISAHQEAWSRINVLHREVNDNAVRILPRVVTRADGSGVREIVWQGVLTNWEWAADVTPGASAKDPPKIDSWKFNSVALNWDEERAVVLADDLESFFYVILYFAIRYIKSNIEDVKRFLHDFFSEKCYMRGSCVFMNGKSAMAKTADGNLKLPDTRETRLVQFDCPLDLLFGKFIRTVQVRYQNKKPKRPVMEDAQRHAAVMEWVKSVIDSTAWPEREWVIRDRTQKKRKPKAKPAPAAEAAQPSDPAATVAEPANPVVPPRTSVKRPAPDAKRPTKRAKVNEEDATTKAGKAAAAKGGQRAKTRQKPEPREGTRRSARLINKK